MASGSVAHSFRETPSTFGDRHHRRHRTHGIQSLSLCRCVPAIRRTPSSPPGRLRSGRRITLTELGAWVCVMLLAAAFPVIGETRLNTATNDSMAHRYASLVQALALPFRTASSIAGVGPGMSPDILETAGTGVTHIFSLVAVAWAEGGIIAMIGSLIVLRDGFGAQEGCCEPMAPAHSMASRGCFGNWIFLSQCRLAISLSLLLDSEAPIAGSTRDSQFGTRGGRKASGRSRFASSERP